jgi:hypothetical protein
MFPGEGEKPVRLSLPHVAETNTPRSVDVAGDDLL